MYYTVITRQQDKRLLKLWQPRSWIGKTYTNLCFLFWCD